MGQAYYLRRPASSKIAVTSDGALTLTVAWSGAQVSKQDGSGIMAAKGVKYTVYAVPVSVGYGGAVNTTGCGLASFVPSQ